MSEDAKILTIKDAIDFNAPVLDISDNPVVHQSEDGGPEEPLRLGVLCVNALMAAAQDDTADGTVKLKRWNLSRKIQKTDENDSYPSIRLNTKQKKMLLDQAEVAYGTLMYARIYEAVEGTTEEEEE
jgi:hypothetical protein